MTANKKYLPRVGISKTTHIHNEMDIPASTFTLSCSDSGTSVRDGCGSACRILHDIIFKIRGYESKYGYGDSAKENLKL